MYRVTLILNNQKALEQFRQLILPTGIPQSMRVEEIASENLTLPTLEQLAIRAALDQNNQNRSAAARMLGLSVRTLQRKINGYGWKQ
jgi:transcriptional regulator with PAS, ATPase and Fis domain